jgi:3-dehydroquinate synthase
MNAEKTIRVELGSRSYDVCVGEGLLAKLGGFVAGLGRVSSAAVISDTNVAALYGQAAMDSLAGANIPARLIRIPAGEQNKTLAVWGGIFDGLFDPHKPVDRDAVILALGGGVPGDMAGFAAASALRGIRWVQCPTTVLAAVDASVGGKTGVDHPAGKNLIGAFYQPRGVLMDVNTLKSLPAAELRSGLAECVKHGVIRDTGLLDTLEKNSSSILAAEAGAMIDLIARNVAVKAAVVSADERESNQRAHLNFGHTIGHAIETLAGYSMSHGEAVSLGMTAAMRLAAWRSLVGEADVNRVTGILSRLGLPTRRQGLDAGELWRIMQQDKKARGGKVRMVLPLRLGKVDIFDDIEPREISRAVESLAGQAGKESS